MFDPDDDVFDWYGFFRACVLAGIGAVATLIIIGSCGACIP